MSEKANLDSSVLAQLNPQEREVMFRNWLGQARKNMAEMWMNYQLAEAHVKRLEEEKAKWG